MQEASPSGDGVPLTGTPFVGKGCLGALASESWWGWMTQLGRTKGTAGSPHLLFR